MVRKTDSQPQDRYSMTIEEAAGYSLIGELFVFFLKLNKEAA